MPKPENLIGNGFDKHPERRNKNGRPRKFVSSVIHELAEQGIENVKPSQIIDLYEKLMNCTIAQLHAYAQDDDTPWEVRQTARYMLKHPEKAWNDIKDRAHGRAIVMEKVEHTGKVITGFEFEDA